MTQEFRPPPVHVILRPFLQLFKKEEIGEKYKMAENIGRIGRISRKGKMQENMIFMVFTTALVRIPVGTKELLKDEKIYTLSVIVTAL